MKNSLQFKVWFLAYLPLYNTPGVLVVHGTDQISKNIGIFSGSFSTLLI